MSSVSLANSNLAFQTFYETDKLEYTYDICVVDNTQPEPFNQLHDAAMIMAAANAKDVI